MKGLELPVNILVVIAVAVIVLLGITALYLAGFTPFGTSISTQSAWNAACQNVVASCSYYDTTDRLNDIVTIIDADGDGSNDDLMQLCQFLHKNATPTSNEAANCRRACGCPN